jgi:hypothetical protein
MTSNYDLVLEAQDHLRKARDLLKQAGAKKSVARVRLALTSVGGAARHAMLEPHRVQRQQTAARR